MFKKLALIFLSTLLFLNSMALPLTALAAEDAPSTWYNQNPFQWYEKVYGKESSPSEIFGERYTAAQVQWILYSLLTVPIMTLETFNSSGSEGSCLFGVLGGITAIPACVTSYISTITETLKSFGIGMVDNTNRSAVADIFNTDNRDISAIKYFSNNFNKFSIIKDANAQEGFGFGAMGTVRGLWTGSRNASYAIIVLIVIVFSFMIMFRVKLSPQLVISVQSALPKVFTALILATFSFAIAGLMIDLMYVFMGLVSALLSSATDGLIPFASIYSFISGNWLGVHVSGFLIVFVYMITYTLLFFISIVMSIMATLSSLSVFGSILSILFLLVVVWLIVLCFWYMIKIPWMLIKTLAAVYISVIIAPLQIIFGAIAPQIGFGQWIKNLIANLLVFPITGIFFWIAYILVFKSFLVGVEAGIEKNIFMELIRMFGFNIEGFMPGNLWSPPLLGEGAEISGLIFAIMSFMVIVAIPKTTEIVKMLVMGTKFEFGSAIGDAMGPVKMAGGLGAEYGLNTYVAGSKKADAGTPWDVASAKGAFSKDALKYVSLSALQKFLSGR